MYQLFKDLDNDALISGDALDNFVKLIEIKRDLTQNSYTSSILAPDKYRNTRTDVSNLLKIVCFDSFLVKLRSEGSGYASKNMVVDIEERVKQDLHSDKLNTKEILSDIYREFIEKRKANPSKLSQLSIAIVENMREDFKDRAYQEFSFTVENKFYYSHAVSNDLDAQVIKSLLEPAFEKPLAKKPKDISYICRNYLESQFDPSDHALPERIRDLERANELRKKITIQRIVAIKNGFQEVDIAISGLRPENMGLEQLKPANLERQIDNLILNGLGFARKIDFDKLVEKCFEKERKKLPPKGLGISE